MEVLALKAGIFHRVLSQKSPENSNAVPYL